MILLKMIIYLSIISLILLNICLCFIIYYFYSNRKITINIDTKYLDSDERYYFKKAKEIIRKEGSE